MNASLMWNSRNGPVALRPVPTPFTAKDLPRRGVTHYALASESRYEQVFRGVWIDTSDPDVVPVPAWADSLWNRTWIELRSIRLLHRGLAGGHATAARLYGLPLPNRMDSEDLHVSTGDMAMRVERPGVRLHRRRHFASEHIALLDVSLVTVPLLLVELAPDLSRDELVQLGDAAIGRQAGAPYISLDELKRSVLDHPRLRSRDKLEEALSLMRPTVDSPRETWLRLWLIANGFPEPAVHPAVPSEVGKCILHPDLGYPDLRIAIEYEGDHHRTSPDAFAADIRRRELLEAEGWVVLRVAKRTDMGAFSRSLSTHMARRGGMR